MAEGLATLMVLAGPGPPGPEELGRQWPQDEATRIFHLLVHQPGLRLTRSRRGWRRAQHLLLRGRHEQRKSPSLTMWGWMRVNQPPEYELVAGISHCEFTTATGPYRQHDPGKCSIASLWQSLWQRPPRGHRGQGRQARVHRISWNRRRASQQRTGWIGI